MTLKDTLVQMVDSRAELTARPGDDEREETRVNPIMAKAARWKARQQQGV